MTWLEIGLVAYKTVVCYVYLIIILKIMGKREVGKVSTFDIVVFFVISELFSLSLNEPEHSILRSLVPITIIVVLQILTAVISLKSKKIRDLTEGKPTYIIIHGKIDLKAMKKSRYNIDDLMQQLHQKDIQTPRDVEFAFIEDTGELSIIKKKGCMVKFPEPIIIDGKISKEYLKMNNIDEEYVLKKIKAKGYDDPKKIFFAQDLVDDFYIIPFKETINKEDIH